jgi:hypothetical protein
MRGLVSLGMTCALAFSAALVGTTRDVTGSRQSPDSTYVVFDCYYANFAWLFTMRGNLVDSNGNVIHYKTSDRVALQRVDKEQAGDYISREGLTAKLSWPGNTRVRTIDPALLRAKAVLIPGAAAGTIRRSDGGVRDAGSSACYAYLPEEGGRRFKMIALGTYGKFNDTNTTNDAPAARDLLKWLQTDVLKRPDDDLLPPAVGDRRIDNDASRGHSTDAGWQRARKAALSSRA